MTKLMLLALLPLTACAADPAPGPGGDVVGTWRERPNATAESPPSVEYRIVIQFADDGTFTRTAGTQPPEDGTYALTDGRIAMTTEGSTIDVPYFADGERFMLGIHEPDDDGADPIATWTAYSVFPDGRLDNLMVLGADASAHLEQTTDAGTETYDGTWVEIDDDVKVSFTIDENTSFGMLGSFYAGFIGSSYEPI